MITSSFGLTATERVLPKLALDFTTATLDSRITFTRALNTATVVNSLGLVADINADLPRFDYDPVWAAYAVTPTAPRRVFAGVQTYFYKFPDQETFEAAQELL